ncbi:Uncharacterised protein [Mycobacterium tuberculosis]|nr:Uncharacterised protein [Mycobacterium tuberculosis]CNK04714.1 Uncharacterised protein [Mycobacterium tuberculosis]
MFIFSIRGMDSGSPYTVAEEENTMEWQSASSIAYSRFRVPATLVW